jgi:hypothetical protein
MFFPELLMPFAYRKVESGTLSQRGGKGPIKGFRVGNISKRFDKLDLGK